MKLTLHFQRFEFKYPLHKPTADKIIPALLKHMKWDQFVKDKKEKFYQVTSLYFDNNTYGCFWEKEAGVKFRKKFRLRTYEEKVNDDTKIFVEIKRKNDSLIIKDRAILTLKEARDILINNKLGFFSKNINSDDLAVINEFFWTKNYNCLKPKIIVRYNRKPLISKQDKNVRVTFDYDIEAKLGSWFNTSLYGWKKILPGSLILEIKYNNVLPYWLHEIIQKYQLERVAFSKYCNSLRTCISGLDDGSAADVANYLGL